MGFYSLPISNWMIYPLPISLLMIYSLPMSLWMIYALPMISQMIYLLPISLCEGQYSFTILPYKFVDGLYKGLYL